MTAAQLQGRNPMDIAQIAGRPAMPYRLQFCQGDLDITGDPCRETYADMVRAWDGAHGDVCLAEIVRTPRRRWRITTSDTAVLPVSVYDRRFPSPLDALGYIAKRAQKRPVEATCRCGTPDECD
jgi:hypothetical protein